MKAGHDIQRMPQTKASKTKGDVRDNLVTSQRAEAKLAKKHRMKGDGLNYLDKALHGPMKKVAKEGHNTVELPPKKPMSRHGRAPVIVPPPQEQTPGRPMPEPVMHSTPAQFGKFSKSKR